MNFRAIFQALRDDDPFPSQENLLLWIRASAGMLAAVEKMKPKL